MAEYVLDCSRAQDVRKRLDAFTFAYIEAAMWTLPEDDDGNTLDHLGLHDIAPATIAVAIEECARFQAANRTQLARAGSDAQNGHDFWLTRNGHGAGYWDRGYSKTISERLTNAARAAGSADWYLGDDGLVYQL